MMEIARTVMEVWTTSIVALPRVKTLDFVEVVAMMAVLDRTGLNTLRLLELGTQHGISAAILARCLGRLGIRPAIVTYDIQSLRHFFEPGEAEFRCEDITDTCGGVLDELDPHVVFLDAHPWHLTLNMTVEARRRNKLIFAHDVSDDLWNERLQGGRLSLEGNETNALIPWERKVLEAVFGPEIHGGHHVTDDYEIDLVRSTYGVALCQPLKGPLAGERKT
ncbi:MAG: hypothetical protein HY343_04370 [Lentisphaerae bacterium]|nr:hypothetical protein [Lentisphaerota bacterium]